MSKLAKLFVGAAFVVSLAFALPGVAQARYGGHGGSYHGAGYRGGGGHYGGYRGGWYGGWGPGFALGFGLGYGAPYYGGYYYAPPPRCGWVRARYWRYGSWHWRRVWRCW